MFIPSTFKRPVSSWKALNLRKTLLMASSVRLKPLNCSRLPCVYAQETPFFFSSRRRHTIWTGDWSSDVCSSDLSIASSSSSCLGVQRQLPCAEHGEDELAIEQRCPVVVVRIVAVCECLVGVLIDAGIIKTVSVGCVGIQRKTLVCADAIRGEARVVIGESETRPKEQTTADLRGCGGSRSQPECRLDALKDVAHALVGDL